MCAHHLLADFLHDVPHDRSNEPGLSDKVAEFKRLYRVRCQRIFGTIKNAMILATLGKTFQDPPHFLLHAVKLTQRRIHVRNATAIYFYPITAEGRLLARWRLREDPQQATKRPFLWEAQREFLQAPSKILLRQKEIRLPRFLTQIHQPVEEQAKTAWIVGVQEGLEPQRGAPQVVPITP